MSGIPASTSAAAEPAPRAWYDLFLDRGTQALADGEGPRFPYSDHIAAARAVARRLQGDPQLAARLANRGVDQPFVAAGLRLADELERGMAEVPPRARAWELVSPEGRGLLEEAASELATTRAVILDAARSRSMREAARVSQGMSFDRASPAAVRRGIERFLAAIEARSDLLAEAGMGPGELEVLRSYLGQVAALTDGDGVHTPEVQAALVRLDVHALALESFFNLYRARARLALVRDPRALEAALSCLPRLGDRRRA